MCVAGGVDTHHRYVDSPHKTPTIHRCKSSDDLGGKGGELALAKSMKEKFKLVKKSCGYVISSICDPAMKVATQILAGKVM